MKIEALQQTTSLARQFRMLVLAVVFFFLTGLVGLYFSSKNSLQSLSTINSANEITNLCLEARESMTTSSQALQKAFDSKKLSDARFLFSSGQKIAIDKIHEAIVKSRSLPELTAELQRTLVSIEIYDKAAFHLFDKLQKGAYTAKELKTELLITNEYDLDIKESLVRAQIELKKHGDASFRSAYQKRHAPLLVAALLTLISLSYVMVKGIGIYRNFERSIQKLLSVTDMVSHGNLEVQAPILKKDEIGRLTHAFNQMVLSLKENQDQLNQAILSREEFLSIASHELKTPLTPLKLQLMVLTKHVEKGTLGEMPPERLQKMTSTLTRQINRMEHLIEDLLDVTKIRAGRLQLIHEESSVSEMVSELVASYQPQFEQVKCALTLELEPNVIGTFDRLRVEQVFTNLLMNAIKYAPGKPVLVSLQTHDGMAEISVHDRGGGISMEDQKRIFDRFERVKERDNIGGLGLGLYICRQIMEAHGGSITVRSELGSGSTFSMHLPLQS